MIHHPRTPFLKPTFPVPIQADLARRYPEATLRALAQQLRQEVGVRDRSYRLVKYPSVFKGTDAVSWVLRHRHAATVTEALQLLNLMMERQFFHHVLREHIMENK
jgi:hypothetical protein